jgi:hypothetical protein
MEIALTSPNPLLSQKILGEERAIGHRGIPLPGEGEGLRVRVVLDS